MAPDFADRVEMTTRELRAAAVELNMAMTGDGRVSEDHAAALIGLGERWLAQLRNEGKGPTSYNIGLGGSRYTYRLSDLASFVEARREIFD